MSVSVVQGNSNLYSDLQSLLQQATSTAAGGVTPGNTPEFLVLVMGPITPAAAGATPTPSGSGSTEGAPVGLSQSVGGPQFSSSTFAAMFTSQSSPQSWGQGGPGWEGHWCHHHHGSSWAGGTGDNLGSQSGPGSNSASALGLAGNSALGTQTAPDLLGALQTGGAATTAKNPDGSVSSTITYADGSTVTLKTPASSTGASGSSSTGAAGSPFSGSALEKLVAAQANALSSQALWTQMTGGSTASAQQNPTTGNSGSKSTDPLSLVKSALEMLTSGDAGAKSNVVQNKDGSATTTISYADGSTLTLNSAPSTSGPGSGQNQASMNFVEEMIQLQAQLLNPTAQGSTQSTNSTASAGSAAPTNTSTTGTSGSTSPPAQVASTSTNSSGSTGSTGAASTAGSIGTSGTAALTGATGSSGAKGSSNATAISGSSGSQSPTV